LGAEGDVLHEVLLVALRGLSPLLLLLVRLRRAQRIAALVVELGRLVPLLGHAEEAGRLQGVALLQEELRRLGRLLGRDVDVGRLLVVAGLQVVVGGLVQLAQLLESGGGGEELLALEVRVRGFGQAAGVLEQLARGQVMTRLLVRSDLAVGLGFAVARPQYLSEDVVHASAAPPRAGKPHARCDLLIGDKNSEDDEDLRQVRNGKDEIHLQPGLGASGRRL
jgi:hypothetical protein